MLGGERSSSGARILGLQPRMRYGDHAQTSIRTPHARTCVPVLQLSDLLDVEKRAVWQILAAAEAAVFFYGKIDEITRVNEAHRGLAAKGSIRLEQRRERLAIMILPRLFRLVRL